MKSPLVSVIIPVFNKFSLTRQCLESLRAYSSNVRLEVIVVDNGSTDETATGLDALGTGLFSDDFMPIRLDTNRNFGPACNLGAREARGEYLFFLNNDTILTDNWLPPLLEGMRGKCVMTGPLLVYPDSGLFGERVQHLGVGCMPQLHPCHLYEFFPATHPVVRRSRQLQIMTGAAFLVPNTVFFEAGAFHEQYINGGEDIDLCVQLRKLGYAMRCVPESVVYHLQSQTPGRHDHEKHNADILRERCARHMYPDIHLHLEQDGYELGVDEYLVPFARLPERRHSLMERAFFRGGEHPELDACLEMMRREPLFRPAYDMAVRHYERAGDHVSVSRVSFLAHKLFPSVETARHLMTAADRVGNDEYYRYGANRIAKYDELARDASLEAMACEMVEYGRHLDQPSLIALYENWLTGRPQVAEENI